MSGVQRSAIISPAFATGQKPPYVRMTDLPQDW